MSQRPSGGTIRTHLVRSVRIAVALVCLFAASSALAARNSHGGRSLAKHPRHPRHLRAQRVARHTAVVGKPSAARPAGVVLLGEEQVLSTAASLAPGESEAFQFRARNSGQTSAVHVYLGIRNSARTLSVGVYSNSGSTPGTLLASGTLRSVQGGGWDTVVIPAQELTAGNTYWLALLGGGGSLRIRERAQAGCATASNTVRSGSMTSVWQTSAVGRSCPVSAFVTGTPAVPLEEPIGEVPPAEEPRPAPEEPARVAPSNTALPSVSGGDTEGQTLEGTAGSWSGSPSSFAYQWQDCDAAGAACHAVAGASSSAYLLTGADVGHTLRLLVTATNAGGSSSASSAPTPLIQATPPPPPPAPVNVALPAVEGLAVEGQTLAATTGTWTGSPTGVTYQWRLCDALGLGCAAISGQGAATLTLSSADVGHTLQVLVTAENEGGATAAASEPTLVVLGLPPLAPVNTTPPSITGTAVEGQSLKAGNGTWSGSPTSFAYQWQDCDSSGSGCTNISGATTSTRVLASSDLGHTLRVVVTALNSGGSTPASSAATSEVTSGGGTHELIGTKTITRAGSSGDAKKGELTLIKYAALHSGTLEEIAYHTGYEPAEGQRATSLKLLVYEYTTPTGQEGKPGVGALLAEGTYTGVVAAAETTVKAAVSPHLTLTAGHNYWLGFLPLGEDKPGGEGRITYNKERSETAGAIFYFLRGISTPPASGASSTWLEEGTRSSGVIKEVANGSQDGPPIEIWGIGKEGAGATPSNMTTPAISGTAQEGQTLTASNGSWTNNPTSYSYQWQDCNSLGEGCLGIAGATASSYKLAAGDVGGTMRVVVTATNPAGSTSASSSATAAVSAAGAQGVLLGSNSMQPNPDGDTAGSAEAFQYTASGSGTVHSLGLYVNAGSSAPLIDVGLYGDGSGHAATLLAQGTITSPSAGAWNMASIASVTVTSGTVYWLAALAPSGSLSLRDVASGGGMSQASASSSLSQLPGSWSGGSTWPNSPASFYASGEAVESPSPSAPVNTALPSITGTTVEGETLVSHTGSWNGSPTGFAYQWQDCDGAGASCSSIPGAAGPTHVLSGSEVGHTLRVIVTATNATGSTPATSPATGTIEAPPPPSAPVNTVLPSIAGSAVEGQTLSADHGSWSGSPTSYAYQWQDCNGSNSSCSNISGQTAATHVLAPSELGHTLRVTVTATNSTGSTPAVSAASAEVSAGGSEGEETEAEAYEYRTEPRFLKPAGSSACSQTVSTTAAMESAVGKAPGGAVICLKGGTYGAFAIEGTHSSQVTVQPVPGESVTIEVSQGTGVKDGNSGDETAILIRPGTTHVTIHGFRQTVKGVKGGNLVGIVVDANPCKGSYKEAGCGSAGHGTDYIRLDHNDVSGGYQGIELFSENECYPHNPVWNATVEAECAGAGKSTGIWGTIEHTIISGNHIHGFNGSDPEPQEDAFRASNFRYLRYTESEVNGIVQGKQVSPPHSDGFQVFYGGEDLVWDHNYYHDNASDAMLLKDGDLSNVALYDNLIVRSQGSGETGLQIWCSYGVNLKRNTIWGGTNGLARAGAASGCPQAPNNYEQNAENNVLQQYSQYSGTEYFSHYIDKNNVVGKGAMFGRAWGEGAGDEVNANPAFACGASCGEGKDGYELTSNPKAAGITWQPGERSYGP